MKKCHKLSADGRTRRAGEVFGYGDIARQYHRRYGLPVMHTETNFWLISVWGEVLPTQSLCLQIPVEPLEAEWLLLKATAKSHRLVGLCQVKSSIWPGKLGRQKGHDPLDLSRATAGSLRGFLLTPSRTETLVSPEGNVGSTPRSTAIY